ncbi:putative toxin-antitoxin system, toxin component [Caldibacillus thermoamylovorans]|uniref:Putative toxin-antitoxin system, toxin component n=1 Tax=Caldibacillus thermoamylovorans TaxID=35841 RepID=A0A090IRL8_9BACI|nr:restriction endonuclease subunit S [Caldibacillus thermoamylovorans]MCM3056445.1 restriction endonuclease subunit S [Caldibacillus thermoamylovorans]CEE00297.1 putative toxin-antitoxin system, toxin component [Caldibacillus thermoamylovorans]
MSFNEWREEKLEDVIEFNPSETIKRGKVVKKIGMDKLMPFQRKIEGFVVTKYTSGTKFRNGDTLLARITPCLENGKTAQVSILEEGEVGFGSTEFIVLREKPGISDRNFIYYLSISPKLRDIAIKSMTGTSGRQRAQVDVIKNSIIKLPPIEEQRQIANILSSLDEKIEINNEINKKLEELAQAIFKHWFVDFEFPNENGEPYKSSGGEMVESELGMIPKGWNIGVLDELIEISSGKRPSIKAQVINEELSIPLVGASSIMGYTNEFNYNEPVLVIGRVGTHGIVQRFNTKIWASDNTLVIKSKYYEYVNQILNIIDYKALNRGSTQPLITQSDIKNYKIIIPDRDYLLKYEELVGSLFLKYEKNYMENENLKTIRDTLLPKLMSGEIRVPVEEEK